MDVVHFESTFDVRALKVNSASEAQSKTEIEASIYV